jgi:hypothetical protein
MCTVVFEGDSSSGNAAMPDLEAGGIQIADLVPAGASKEQLVRALLLVSYASLFVGVYAGLHQPAAMGSVFARHQAGYYSVVAAILAAVPVEMATAFWLSRSHGPRFHAFAKVLQRIGVMLLIIVSAVGGIEFTLKV